MVGGQGVSYGRLPAGEQSYLEQYLGEVQGNVDEARLHILDHMEYLRLLNLYQITSAHVYLTYPFVLSWSLLEAMSAGAVVVASATPPVEEVVSDGENGLLFDFFSPGELAEKVVAVLSHPDRMRHLGRNARQSVVARYDLRSTCLPAHLKLISDVSAHRRDLGANTNGVDC
jgi:glycosyltransferase involved in cell wall biosynthesis